MSTHLAAPVDGPSTAASPTGTSSSSPLPSLSGHLTGVASHLSMKPGAVQILKASLFGWLAAGAFTAIGWTAAAKGRRDLVADAFWLTGVALVVTFPLVYHPLLRALGRLGAPVRLAAAAMLFPVPALVVALLFRNGDPIGATVAAMVHPGQDALVWYVGLAVGGLSFAGLLPESKRS